MAGLERVPIFWRLRAIDLETYRTFLLHLVHNLFTDIHLLRIYFVPQVLESLLYASANHWRI